MTSQPLRQLALAQAFRLSVINLLITTSLSGALAQIYYMYIPPFTWIV
ncbi:hypothetical protein FORC59_1111 [Staphylococcus aureus]|nr:hypothetical protein FORC59_1111 [Staphylococcus aureus]